MIILLLIIIYLNELNINNRFFKREKNINIYIYICYFFENYLTYVIYS